MCAAGPSQGKTFIVANVIQEARLPTLVLAPNKASRWFCGLKSCWNGWPLHFGGLGVLGVASHRP